MSAEPSRRNRIDAPSLADEACYLHSCLFRQPLSPFVISRYEAAHRELFPNEAPSPLVAVVVEKRLDAEAVEFALRRRQMGKELGRKILIVCYIVESQSAYLGEFVNASRGRRGAFAALLGSAISSVWKLAKGEYLIRRHGLL